MTAPAPHHPSDSGPKAVYVALQQFCEADARPRRALEEAGFEVLVNALGRRLRREELPRALAGADAVIAGVEPFDRALLASLPRLRLISRCGVGTDAVDLEAARALGIAVRVTAEEVVEPVAEMAVAMMLALARNLPLHVGDFRSGAWNKRSGHLLSEWTIGLLGFGRIGRAVERLLRAFGPRILVCDPFLGGDLPSGVGLRGLEELLGSCDLVSVHADRSGREGPLLGRAELSAMKPGARLVNTARGHLLDEAALLDALESGRLSAAALDVFEEEPYGGPLSRLPQVLCTPHVSTLTRASRAAMELRSARNVVEFFAHTPRRSPSPQEGPRGGGERT